MTRGPQLRAYKKVAAGQGRAGPVEGQGRDCVKGKGKDRTIKTSVCTLTVRSFSSSPCPLTLLHYLYYFGAGEFSKSPCEDWGMPRELAEHYIWVCLWGCVWRRSAFESVDSVKKITIASVGGNIPSTEGQNRTNKGRKGRGTPSDWAATPFLSCPHTWALLALRTSGLDWNRTTSSPGFWLVDIRSGDLSFPITVWTNSS